MPTNPHKKRFRKDLRDAHREYSKERKELGYTKHPTYKQYSGVIVDFFKEIFKMIVQEDFTFVTSIGIFTLAASKQTFSDPSGPPVDKKTSADKKKKIYHVNDHSHNYVYRVLWIKDDVRLQNAKIYELAVTSYRGIKKDYLGKRGIAKYIKETATDRSKKLPVPKTIIKRND